MTDVKLGYDICRCEGQGCDRRAECMHFVTLDDEETESGSRRSAGTQG